MTFNSNVDLNDVLRDLDAMLLDEDEYDMPQSHLSSLPDNSNRDEVSQPSTISQKSNSSMSGSLKLPIKSSSSNASPIPHHKTVKPFGAPPAVLKPTSRSYSPSPRQSPTPLRVLGSYPRLNNDAANRLDTPAPFGQTFVLNPISDKTPELQFLEENPYIEDDLDLSFMKNRDYVNVPSDNDIYEPDTYDLPSEDKQFTLKLPEKKMKQSEIPLPKVHNENEEPPRPRIPPRKQRQSQKDIPSSDDIYDVPQVVFSATTENYPGNENTQVRKESFNEEIYDELQESAWSSGRDTPDDLNDYSEPSYNLIRLSEQDFSQVDRPKIQHSASTSATRPVITKLNLKMKPPHGAVMVMSNSASPVPGSAPVNKHLNTPILSGDSAPDTSPPRLNSSTSFGRNKNLDVPTMSSKPSLSRSITALNSDKMPQMFPSMHRSASVDLTANHFHPGTPVQYEEESNVYELENVYSEPTGGNLNARRPSDYVVSTNQDKRVFLRQTSTKLSLQSNIKKAIVNMYNVDGSYKTIIINEKMKARDVCELLIIKNHLKHSVAWQLVESLVEENLERDIEDHEVVMDIYGSWPLDKDNRFIFRQNFKKFEVFQNPELYLTNYAQENSGHNTEITNKTQQAKNKLMNEMFLQSDKVAELSGHLWVKEPGRKWRELFCYLRRSGLYYSTRANNKNPKYQYIIIDFSTADIYTSMDSSATKKRYNAPTKDIIIFKNKNEDLTEKETVSVCALDRNNFLCWQQGFRLSKFGVQDLRKNFRIATTCHEKLKELSKDKNTPSPSPRGNKSQFDFGANETAANLHQQHWFHGELSKDAAAQRIVTYAQEDGSFLVREFDRQYFICMKFMDKIQHIKLQSVPFAGKTMWTIEAGQRNFPNLIDLIDHYSKQMGSLSCLLSVPIDNSLS